MIDRLRAVTKEDIPVLLALEKECFSDAWSQEQLISEISRNGFLGLVAEENGEILGYAFFGVLFETAELERIAVQEGCRGKGVGGMLLDEGIKKAKALGAEEMLLEVREGNLSAIRLYESRNFVPFHIRKGYYAGGENAVEMKKELTEKALRK